MEPPKNSDTPPATPGETPTGPPPVADTPETPAEPTSFAGSTPAADIPAQPDTVSDPPTPGETIAPAPAAASADTEPAPTTPPLAADSSPAADAIVPMPLPLGSPRPRKKGKILAVIIAAAVVVLAGGAAAAYQYAVNKPENVLKRALANTLDDTKTKTMHFSGSIEVDDAEMGMNGEFTGAINNETGALDVSANLDVLLAKMTFDIRSVDGKSHYIRVGGLAGLPELLGMSDAASSYAPLIAAVNDQWLEINQSVAEQFTGGLATGEQLSDSDRQKLVDLYQKHEFFGVKEALPDEDVKAVKSYHYKVGIDKAKFKAFVVAVSEAKIAGLEMSKAQLDEFEKSLNEAKLDETPFEVWISKKDKMLKQMAVTITEDGVSTKLRLTVDSYNQPVEVVKPENPKSFLEVISRYLFGGLETTMPAELQSGISL